MAPSSAVSPTDLQPQATFSDALEGPGVSAARTPSAGAIGSGQHPEESDSIWKSTIPGGSGGSSETVPHDRQAIPVTTAASIGNVLMGPGRIIRLFLV